MTKRESLLDDSARLMRDFMTYSVLYQDSVARAAGLTASDLQALGMLINDGPASPGVLAGRTGISAGGGITQLVDRLESAGFVRRERSATDRRRVVVSPVLPEVERRVGPLYARIGAEWREYLESLSDDDLRVCVNFMTAAVDINRRHLGD
ncbi:MarR family winged helix-turn-helix transcriptional regulator [Kribbella solani]|uniref:DNA-binding MarR family transcriptional regulator n=1 Tax=Kribbella solani TaxID=236067 RepID=A0A841DR79_9ACTN|nr:MarR family transcriptional regulator [Kribbella solani]MBB5979425.1 DNA-binding MarR family transcriptional regulator [Kribbella solani]MDX2969638.1 MarR family transcriptional regulator [Kribbella solani]MDX3003261.1 MarR family transcriptional regulator [Kribbella solani]